MHHVRTLCIEMVVVRLRFTLHSRTTPIYTITKYIKYIVTKYTQYGAYRDRRGL